MSVLLLVRHGQAQFGTDDYDRLSAAGHEQAHRLGVVLAAQGLAPSGVIAGALQRQQATAASLVEGARWDLGVTVDSAWDEFDHLALLHDHPEDRLTTDSRAFQPILEAGMRRWSEGHIVQDSRERFAEFTARTEKAAYRVASESPPGGTTVVVTSAGVISWVVSHLLGGDAEQWIRLNRVCINGAVTKLVHGRHGLSLISFNDHSHLDPAEVTYR